MMPISRAAALLLLAATLVLSGGCRFFGGKRKPLPPAPAPPVQQPKTPEPEPVKPEPVKPEVPKPEPPRPPAPKPKPQPAPVPAPTPQPKPPAFGEILTPRQQAEFARAYEASAKSAREALASANGRTLTREQTDTANRVRSFLKQAEDARAKDPATAAQLARRAEILAASLR